MSGPGLRLGLSHDLSGAVSGPREEILVFFRQIRVDPFAAPTIPVPCDLEFLLGLLGHAAANCNLFRIAARAQSTSHLSARTRPPSCSALEFSRLAGSNRIRDDFVWPLFFSVGASATVPSTDPSGALGRDS